MAVTPVGNPYVESSDLVANYPGASEALAERIDIVGVNPFADSAARTTAIPSPTEGMMSSLNDTDAVQRYDGATWKPVGGKVLQVVSASTDTAVASSSSTFAATGLTATITPSSDTSKVLVLVNQNGLRKQQNTSIGLRLNRGATNISIFAYAAYTNNTSDNDVGGTSVSILDAPATASAVTYSTTFNSTSNAVVTNVQLGSVMSTIILMEISA